MQEIIAGRTYEVTDCTRCAGTGKSYDPTCADKVNAGPFAGQCPACRGRAKTYTYVPTAAEVAYREQERRAAREAITFDDSPEAQAAFLASFS